jgi:HPt (histidine-containing phosphotransfer) domain-containing protein
MVERLAAAGSEIANEGIEKNDVRAGPFELPGSEATTGSDHHPTPHHSCPAPVFNFDEAVKKCYGEYSLFQEVAGCLLSDSDSLLGRMRAAIGESDDAELANAAHRLKGTVTYLGAAPALAATRRVEEIGRSGDLSAAPAAVDALAEELDQLKNALRAHQPPRN